MACYAQPEGPTTGIYNYVLGALGRRRRKKKDWQQMLPQVPIFKKKERETLRLHKTIISYMLFIRKHLK